MADDDIRVDVGVLKTQVLTLSAICSKLDQVIEKLVEQHDRHISKVYTDMENRRLETDADVKEIHDRIDTVLEKVQDSERRIMEEMKGFKKAMSEHSETSKLQFERLNQWKWTIAGGILVISWLISHSNLDTIVKSIH
jgi:DNA-directed RNA polymerase sigma subunit (sigma70/sigma32)